MQEMAVTTASPDSLDLAVEIRKLLEGFIHDGLSYKVAQVGSFGFTEYVHFVCMLPTKETVFDFEVELGLPPESVVYPGEGTYKPDRFRDSIYVKTALSQGELMRYYEAQMVRLGWNRQLAQQNSSRVTLSSWIWTSENQQAWQCLLWIVAHACMPSSYSAHLQVVHLGS